jgi:hypothetical protein
MTDGSSVAIRTTTSLPSMLKFVATPTGVMCRVMTFSIIVSHAESAVRRVQMEVRRQARKTVRSRQLEEARQRGSHPNEVSCGR